MREQYLEALGIETWVRRRPSAVPAAAARAAGRRPAASCEPDWEVLQAQVRACVRCSLARTRTQTVFGVGDPHAELFVVGEAPGADEDAQGEPFVGRAGQLLNSMLVALGTARERVYIANILKCRPPGNRDPAPEEVDCCLPYLRRQIELVAPRLMLVVGRVAAQNLLGTDAPLGRLRGRVHAFGEACTPLIVTYHPAYLLRSPGEKRKAWADLKFVREELRRRRPAAHEAGESPR